MMTMEIYLEEHGAETYEDYEIEEEMVQIFHVYLDDGTEKTVAIIADDSYDGHMILKDMDIWDAEWDDEMTLDEAERLGLEII